MSVRDYADTGYGWALEDTTGFASPGRPSRAHDSRRSHHRPPQAATLIQPLIQAMALGLTVDQVGRGVVYIHPALTEVVEQALLAL
ncbi:hypothetical protein [Streptomyces sp. CA-106110]|uniref:hypothetical protein n=1 Tax=Streptomyces sp. CA-106110 TaxID=3240044 RepID=UPI003D8D7FF8